MLVYSIEHARQSKLITRVIVSTDDAYYAELAKTAGAEVPFLRPAALAQDNSTDLEVFQHALHWLAEHEQYTPDLVVHLRPTCPVRNAADIDVMINLLLEHPEADAIRSVVENPEPVFKMWFKDADGKMKPVVEDDCFPEAYNLPRQSLPKAYLQNANIDIARTNTILHKNSMTGQNILGYEMPDFVDIDHYHQLENIAAHGQEDGAKTFVVDIDGVIAFLSPKNDYSLAEGNPEFIKKVNELYDAGHTIVLFTARGSKTGIDWHETTRSQMERWGVKYHELKMGKPFADYYVDDRLLSPVEFLKF